MATCNLNCITMTFWFNEASDDGNEDAGLKRVGSSSFKSNHGSRLQEPLHLIFRP